jgi:hypothetical protein
MTKLKLTRNFYILLVLAFLVLSFASITNAAAYRRGRGRYRPISDWVLNNPRVIYGSTTNWDLLPEGYIVRPIIENSEQYDGYIRERILEDGRAELTVYIRGIDCPFSLYSLQEWYDWEEQDLLIDTEYNCIVIEKFILPEPNQEIPNIFDIYGGVMGEWVSTFSIGFGSGIFTEHAESFNFDPGDEGYVFILQKGYITPEGEEVWPYEIINVY